MRIVVLLLSTSPGATVTPAIRSDRPISTGPVKPLRKPELIASAPPPLMLPPLRPKSYFLSSLFCKEPFSYCVGITEYTLPLLC